MSATEEVENYGATPESVHLELDSLRFDNSRGQARISEGHDRCVTLLRNNAFLTVVGVLQALKGSPKLGRPAIRLCRSRTIHSSIS